MYAIRSYYVPGRSIVKDFEVRSNPGLDRQSLKHRLAERVDGFDDDPAGRVDDLGEFV